ncbi:MAG TPA: MFS transporter [Candidatus Competibacteraceae bacterium]|nr:MFS transporter [Candidatus Competibacteraceae bacterium]
MHKTIASAWALFLGIALMMMCNALQGTLLGVRADAEGFSTAVTGMVMMGYFAGLLAGSLLSPRAVAAVGHIRVYAALSALASTAVLLHAVFIEPWVWGGLRFVTGVCYAGLYVVVESWLNDLASNEIRGRLLSLYMVVTMLAMAGGQYLLTLAPPGGYTAFILASALVSLAAIPMCLSANPAPAFKATEPLGLRDLYRISPLGFVGALGVGMAHASFYGMGAVYANRIGLPLALVSTFMAVPTLGGMLSQWPLGWLSDRWDRRRVITLITFLAAAVAALAGLVGQHSVPLLLACMGLFGVFSLPLYSLNIAHTNDHLRPEQMVAACSTLVLVYSLGAVLGPMVAGQVMERLGSDSYFGWLAGIHAAIGLFAVYRMARRSAPAPSAPLARPLFCDPGGEGRE